MRQILKLKKTHNALDFEVKIVQPVRFWKNFAFEKSQFGSF